jgi:hypothetical protein
MASYLKDILKNQIVELFDDILRLTTITGKNRCILQIGKTITEKTDSDLIMKNLADELISADIENLGNNSENLFNYVFNCLTKKQIENEFIQSSFRDIYHQLTNREREIVADYAKQMKKICEKYREDKKCQIPSLD